MKVRQLKYDDIDTLLKIHHRFYSKDAPPNFDKDFIVVTDNEDQIITCGGIELMAEAIILTNKQFSSHARTSALLELLRSLMLTCSKGNYSFLHATIADDLDETWIRTLGLVGFKPLMGKVLIKEV